MFGERSYYVKAVSVVLHEVPWGDDTCSCKTYVKAWLFTVTKTTAESIRKIHHTIYSWQRFTTYYSIVSTVFTVLGNVMKHCPFLLILHNKIIRITCRWHNTLLLWLHTHYTWFNFPQWLNKPRRLIMIKQAVLEERNSTNTALYI